MTRWSTKEGFVKKAQKIHNNYDYSLVEYTGHKNKVKIICIKHGIFEQTPSDHLNGRGCPKCGAERTQQKLRLGKEKFINKANLIHNNKYDYSKVNYTNHREKVEIICPIHGSFWQVAGKHLMGHGCHICSGRERKSYNKRKARIIESETQELGEIKNNLEDFIRCGNLIHRNCYDYSLTEYINAKTKITIICKIHGTFSQTFGKHIGRKQGCPKCAIEKRRKQFQFSIEEFIERSQKHHEEKYDYSLVEYVNAHVKVNIICKIHGPFLQEPNVHIRGGGCPRCVDSNKSKTATKWLDSFGTVSEREFPITTKLGTKYVVDGYDPSTRTIYEYLGSFWHGNPEFYNAEDINPKNGITFGELYRKTIEKINNLQDDGYNLIYKWGK